MHGVKKHGTAFDFHGRGTIVWHDYGSQRVAPAPSKLYREDPRPAGMRHIDATTLVFAEVGSKPPREQPMRHKRKHRRERLRGKR